jgi:hypothetical protein
METKSARRDAGPIVVFSKAGEELLVSFLSPLVQVQ